MSKMLRCNRDTRPTTVLDLEQSRQFMQLFKRFPESDWLKTAMPVTLPPGRLRLAT